MPGKFHHEAIYRGQSTMAALAAARLTICGAGALGSNLADNLARQGITDMSVIDRDRIEEHNVSTQVYGETDIGAWKVEVLRQHLFRATGIEIDAVRKELVERNARTVLQGERLIIDTLDNSAGRRLVQDQCRALGSPCLHIGLYADYGEAIWDQSYRVPTDVPGDVCDYPLARNLVLLVVAVASELVMRFLLDGTTTNWTVTLRDFSVRPFDS